MDQKVETQCISRWEKQKKLRERASRPDKHPADYGPFDSKGIERISELEVILIGSYAVQIRSEKIGPRKSLFQAGAPKVMTPLCACDHWESHVGVATHNYHKIYLAMIGSDILVRRRVHSLVHLLIHLLVHSL